MNLEVTGLRHVKGISSFVGDESDGEHVISGVLFGWLRCRTPHGARLDVRHRAWQADEKGPLCQLAVAPNKGVEQIFHRQSLFDSRWRGFVGLKWQQKSIEYRVPRSLVDS